MDFATSLKAALIAASALSVALPATAQDTGAEGQDQQADTGAPGAGGQGQMGQDMMGQGMMDQGQMGQGMMGQGQMGQGQMGRGMMMGQGPSGPGYGMGYGPGWGYGVGPGWGMGPGMMAPPGAGYAPIGPGTLGPGWIGVTPQGQPYGMVYGRVGPSTTPGMAPGMAFGMGGPGYGLGSDFAGGGMSPGQWMAGRGGRAPVDTDVSGAITADEAAAEAEAVFNALDEDGDDSLSPQEFGAVGPTDAPATREASMLQLRSEHRRARFQRFDADEDGSISKAEFIGHAEGRFAAADTDGDGHVTPWEWRATRSW